MFKIEEAASDDGEITGIIFMRPDGMFEGRVYRNQSSDFEVCGVAGTLIQMRTLLHEELGIAKGD